MRIIRDYISNWSLNIKNSFRFVFSVPGKYSNLPSQFDTTHKYIDNFKDLTGWFKGHPRGDKHTHQEQIYLDKNVHINSRIDSIYGDRSDSLVLYNTSDGFGSIFSKENYSYGIYQFIIDLPKGKFRCPSISLVNIDTYPPEIQIMKGYSNKYQDYTSLDTDIKLGNNPTNIKSIGFKEHRYFLEREQQTIILNWTKDYIKIYYNGYLVRIITEKRVLKELNFLPKMKVVISNESIYSKNEDKYYWRSEAFKIYQFKYYPV